MRSEAIAVTDRDLGAIDLTKERRVQGVAFRLSRSKSVGIGILNGIENQLQILVAAAGGLHSKQRTIEIKHETKVSSPGCAAAPVRNRQGFRSAAAIGALIVVFGASGWGTSLLIRSVNNRSEVAGPSAVNALVDRIFGAESNNRFDATNKTSSAAGAGQFIEGTWLDLIQEHRPELAKSRTKAETLELRREPKIAREMTARFVERNAALLKKRGLPVTASTIYLAHFAGGQGAVAILSADENADAAWVMAKADAKGRVKRDQIIKANPFLAHYSVGDLKLWADRKMHGPHLNVVKLDEGAANN